MEESTSGTPPSGQDRDVVSMLTMRVDILQRKVAELLEQQTELQRQIVHYRELLAKYRGVMEAESLGLGYHPPVTITPENATAVKAEVVGNRLNISRAVQAVMKERSGQVLHGSEVLRLVQEQFPELRGRGGNTNITHAVTHALLRGMSKGLWSKVEPNVYKT